MVTVTVLFTAEPPRKVQKLLPSVMDSTRSSSGSSTSCDSRTSSGSSSSTSSSRTSESRSSMGSSSTGDSTTSSDTSRSDSYSSTGLANTDDAAHRPKLASVVSRTATDTACSRTVRTSSLSNSDGATLRPKLTVDIPRAGTEYSRTVKTSTFSNSVAATLRPKPTADISRTVRTSPTRATAAISVPQMTTGTKGNSRIHFAEAVVYVGKPAASAADTRSCRLADRSSVADRSNARMHPYRDTARSHDRRRNASSSFSFKQYNAHRSVQDLLECHNMYTFVDRRLDKQPVNPDVLVEAAVDEETPRFAECRFVRVSRAAARDLLGESDVVDDLNDVPFTQNDIKHFDEKKRMAEELDRVLEIGADARDVY